MEATIGLLWAFVTALLFFVYHRRYRITSIADSLTRGQLGIFFLIALTASLAGTAELTLDPSLLTAIFVVAMWPFTLWIAWLALRSPGESRGDS